MKNVLVKMISAANNTKQKDTLITLKEKGLSNITLNSKSSVLHLTMDWGDKTELLSQSDILLPVVECCDVYNKQQMLYSDRKNTSVIKNIRITSEEGYQYFIIPVESLMSINRLNALINASINYYEDTSPENESIYLDVVLKQLTKSAVMLEYRNQATDVARFIKNMYKAVNDDDKLQNVIMGILVEEFKSKLFQKCEINRLVPKVTNIIKTNSIGEIVRNVENCITEDNAIKTTSSEGINMLYYLRSSVACDWATPQTYTYKDIISEDIHKIIRNLYYSKSRRKTLCYIMCNSKFVDMVCIAFILANISK